MQKDIQNSKFMVLLKFLYNAFSSSSWWSCCISPSSPMLVLGWSGRWSWLPKQRDNTEPWNSSGCHWSLWLLLLRTCSFPEYLYFNGKTKPIPWSPPNMVKTQDSLLFYPKTQSLLISSATGPRISCALLALSTSCFYLKILKIFWSSLVGPTMLWEYFNWVNFHINYH